MVKRFKLIDLECAHCAAKMELAIKKIEGVNDASISFMMQKLTIDAPEERLGEILKKAQKAIRKIEPDCTIAEQER